MSHVVIYPAFLECQKYTADQYWKDTLMMCASNKFPKGSRYDSDTHTIHIRNTAEKSKYSEAIPLPTEPRELFNFLVELFREKLDLYSSLDIKLKRREIENIKESLSIRLDCTWKQLKPRSLRDNIIIQYVLRLKDEYNLSPKEVKDLFNEINMGFHFKNINSDDVEYEKGEIIRINRLEKVEGKNEWRVTPHSSPPSQKESTNITPIEQKYNHYTSVFLRDYHTKRIVSTV